MAEDREIQDNNTDREAMRVLQSAHGEHHFAGRDPALLEEAWTVLSRKLAAMSEDDFAGFQGRLEAARETGDARTFERIDDLMNHIIGWRLGDV